MLCMRLVRKQGNAMTLMIISNGNEEDVFDLNQQEAFCAKQSAW